MISAIDILRQQMKKLKVTSDELDLAVHEMKAEEASAINNAGVDSQLEALIKYYGCEETQKLLADLMAGEPK